MDATKLIEEAGRVAAQAAKQSALDSHYAPCTCSAPPRGHTTRQHDYRRLRVDELRAVLDVVERLTAALKASEERARKAEELAAANLAANKRIVELEQQVADAAALRRQDAEHCERLIVDRDAARAELARLTTPRPIAEAPRDGTWILGVWLDIHASVPTAIRWVVDAWADESQENLKEPSHYLPLPEVKP